MTVVFADPCELYVSGSTSHGPSNASSGSSFSIMDRDASGYQDWRYRMVVDALGEGGILQPVMNNGGSGTTPASFDANAELAYVYVPYELTDATPAAVTNYVALITQSTSPFFNGWTVRVTTAGKLALYNASNVLQATGSKTLSDNTLYHLLFGFDATNGIVSVWVGDDDGSGELNDPTQWSGSADVTVTDATQNGTFANISLGWTSIGKTNPASTAYMDGFVYDTEKPVVTRRVWFIPPDASATSEYESGGASGTNWTDEGGSGATTEKVDEGTQHDDDTTYVVAEAGISAGSRWSLHLNTCASVGMASNDEIVAIMPFFSIKKEANSSDLTDIVAFIRNGGVNLDGSDPLYRNGSYTGMWEIFTTGASGEKLTQDLIDGLEIGLIREGTSSDPTNTDLGYRCTLAGLIVVTEKRPSLVKQNRSSQRALLVR